MGTVTLKSLTDKLKNVSPAVLEKISDYADELLVDESNKPRYDAAHAATLSGKEKITYWKEVGISGDELFDRVIAHIDTLPWKK